MENLPEFTAVASLSRNWTIDARASIRHLKLSSVNLQVIPQQLRAPGGTIDLGRIPEDVEILTQEFGKCEEPGCDECAGNVLEGDGLPVYGNWCGPGHGGDPNTPAIDPVDAVCKAHDLCYDERGYFDCSCDREMLERLPAAIGDTRTSAQGKACGELVHQWFSNSPCLCWTELCVPETRWCSRDVPYPCWDWCRIRVLGRTIGWRPCHFRTCTTTVPYICGVETRCWDAPTGTGAGGICYTPGLNVGGWWNMGR